MWFWSLDHRNGKRELTKREGKSLNGMKHLNLFPNKQSSLSPSWIKIPSLMTQLVAVKLISPSTTIAPPKNNVFIFLFKNILVSHIRENLLEKSTYRSDMIKGIQIIKEAINNRIGAIINQIMDGKILQIMAGINNQTILEITDGEISLQIQVGEINKIFIIQIGETNPIFRIPIGEISNLRIQDGEISNPRIQVGVTNSSLRIGISLFSLPNK